MEGSVMTQHPSLEHRVKGMGGDGRDEKPHRGQAPTRENHLEGGVSRTAFFVFTSFILSTFSFPFS